LQYKPKKEEKYYKEERHEEEYKPKKEYYKEEKHEEYEVRLESPRQHTPSHML
jgi:hypothetical protein